MQQRTPISDRRRFADHHPRRMVDQDPHPNPRRRMNVHCKGLGNARLDERRERLLVVRGPEPVAGAVRLEAEEALEVEERVRKAGAGGVAILEVKSF